jgi:hypothetical protein
MFRGEAARREQERGLPAEGPDGESVLHKFGARYAGRAGLSREESRVAGGAGREYGATVAKRRLSRRLAAMREAAGLRPGDVDDKLGWRRGKLARIERNEWILPNPSYVRDLLRVYQAPDAEQDEVTDLVGRAGVRPWWRKYAQPGDAARVFDNEFPGFENDAARISVYMPLVLPGLLQAPAYIDAMMASGSRPPEWRERARQARVRRQEILDRTDGTAPRLVAVITEASLRYHWGTLAERRAQVAHLAEVSRRPSVELRVLRFEDGPHPGMSSLVNLFGFADDQDPPIAYLETDTSVQEIDRPEDVQALTDTFAQIRQAALAPARTTAYLEELTGTLE